MNVDVVAIIFFHIAKVIRTLKKGRGKMKKRKKESEERRKQEIIVIANTRIALNPIVTEKTEFEFENERKIRRLACCYKLFNLLSFFFLSLSLTARYCTE